MRLRGDIIKNICHMYDNAKLSACSKFLGNTNPLIKDNRIIYQNLNRLFFFISIENNQNSDDTFSANLQISLNHYIVGLFIHNLLIDKSNYDQNLKITDDEKSNKVVHNLIQNPPSNLKQDLNYYLILVYANQNAILNPFNYSIKIKPLTFYILLILNRIEKNPGLFFVNNDHVTEDTINFILASLHIEIPKNLLYNDKKK